MGTQEGRLLEVQLSVSGRTTTCCTGSTVIDASAGGWSLKHLLFFLQRVVKFSEKEMGIR